LAQIFDHLLDASQPFVVVVTIDRHAPQCKTGLTFRPSVSTRPTRRAHP